LSTSGGIQNVSIINSTINAVLREFRVYANSGTFLTLHSGDSGWQAPDSGSSWIVQGNPNSYCSADDRAMWLPVNPLGMIGRHNAIYAESTDTTVTIKVYPVGWASSLTDAEILFEVWYLNSATIDSRTRVTNGTATYANGAWRSVTATISPAKDGPVYWNLWLRCYESGDYVLVDPEVVAS